MNMKQQKIKSMGLYKQQGVVMMVSLIMLLLITILGVSAVHISQDKTQIAGNSIYSMLVYQGAESALARTATVSSEKQIIDAIATITLSNPTYNVPSEILADTAETINDTSISMTSSARITPIRGTIPCPISNSATSSAYICRAVEIRAITKLSGTGARAQHTEARSKTIAM